MFRAMTCAVLALVAAPAFAQSATAPASPPAPMGGPPPEFMTAAMAYGECMKNAVAAVPASVTPEAGAQQVLENCATTRTALDTRFEAWIASPGFPDAGRATAREQYKARMSMVSTKIADGIRESRAAPAPAPTPTPVPSGK